MEEKRILFYTANTEAARATADAYTAAGHQVCIYQEAEDGEAFLEAGVDLLVLSMPEQDLDAREIQSGQIGTEKQNYQEMADIIFRNTQPLLAFAEKVIPYMKGSTMKRIAYLTDKSFSVRESTACDGFGIHMAGAANHMMMKVLHNTYRPQGYTFRCFAWRPGNPGIPAWYYFLQNQSYIAIDPPCHSDENRLVLRDSMLRELSW